MCTSIESACPADGTQDEDIVRATLSQIGWCGRFLHFNQGGNSGKAPILIKLSCEGGNMNQRQLQETFGLKAGSLSEMLSKLEGMEFITRTRDTDDRRQLMVSLTSKGREAAKHELDDRSVFESHALSCLSNDEQQLLLDLLTKVHTHWRSLNG